MNQDFYDPEVYADFVVEAREHLETIEPKLLELEKNPDDLSLLDDIFRPMHSLKGASGFLGLKLMNSLAHKGENILDELRRGRMKVTSGIMDLILEATDALREMVENLEAQGNEGEVDTAHIIKHIEELMQSGGVDSPASEKPSSDEAEQQSDQTSKAEAGDAGLFKTEESYALTMVSQDHLNDFIEEVQEILAEVTSMLITLESNEDFDREVINDLFRSFHNIKGNSAIIGFKEINRLSHEAESILNKVRNNELEISHELIDVLLTISDTLETVLNNVDRESSEVTGYDISDVLEKVDKALQNQPKFKKEVNSVPDKPEVQSQKQDDSPAESEKSNTQSQADHKDNGSESVASDQENFDPEDLQIFEQAVAQQFENLKLALEKINSGEADKEIIDGLYRSLVTIQNSTGYMGFDDLKTYAARTAELVDQGRKSDLDFELMGDLLKQETSILQSMVDNKLTSIASSSDSKPDPGLEPEHDSETTAESDQASNGPGSVDTEPENASREVESKQTEPEKDSDVGVQTGPSQAETQDNQACPKEPDKSAPASKSNQPPSKKDRTKPTIASTIRVDHSRLDDLMNLIGELIINRNRFAMLSKSLEEGHDVQEIAQQLTETTNSMARISDDLQVTIMNVRMVPVQTVFTKFPRLVRDLSRKSNKKVQLITEGEDTELDKSVVELIGDPLVHLIRNSLDHGLEQEDMRVKAGKDPLGTVWLRAAHRGNSVVIEVEDDGRGIDPEKMKSKALEKGIITQEKAQSMEDQEAIDLIFAPGFSTAEKVTDISGRGVGMDVVKNNIKNLKGSVLVHSTLGKGSKFSITLPLTLAIIDALMVKMAGQTYAIPLDAVSETTKIEAAKLSEINNRKAVTLRGEVLGLAELSELLELPVNNEDREVLPVVIIVVGDRRLGLVVDTLLERQEVVIKSLGEYMGEQPGISGATIMGDGSVVLILDPHEIYKMATSRF
ncbi:chemotaxis protein CheA [Desulfonatronovibrio magnus]|uniref:chemotaxis protein CheA n=1 Tax=Desulfonatronovibrio magnus TaxID=698827 RepID=UPI0005EBAB75|nr:chemotaxis protein CheA [Desulfonatronovibrio magnus]